MWEQHWVVSAPTAEAAAAVASAALARWTPARAPSAQVGEVRFYQGQDDVRLTNQYLEDVAEIQSVVANTPREQLAQQFARVRQRGLGIPPRAGWVVLDDDGPRSPRPLDWSRRRGPMWVVEVVWPGEVPQLDR